MSIRRASQGSFKRPLRAKALISLARKQQNPLNQKMLVLGYLTDQLEKKKQHVYLVGGQAVETYTAGQFTTGDVDITTSDSKATEKVLVNLGFEQIGMIWLNKRVGMAVQIVGLFPNANLEKASTILAGPYKVRIIGVEDLIVDRLAHVKFFNVSGDLEKAKVLYTVFKNRIDEEYLRKTAKKRRIEDLLDKIADFASSNSIRRN
jgi:hypothetical protein